MERIRSLFRGLVLEGTYIDDLRDPISETFSTELTWEYYPESGEKIRQVVADHILADHPVIVGLRYHGGGHAVVGVGLKYVEQDNDKLFVRDSCFLILGVRTGSTPDGTLRSGPLPHVGAGPTGTTAAQGKWPGGGVRHGHGRLEKELTLRFARTPP